LVAQPKPSGIGLENAGGSPDDPTKKISVAQNVAWRKSIKPEPIYGAILRDACFPDRNIEEN
jgi:hypothetical protein